jgi:phosphatidylinositol N-acetylglucosaminyltransferase subunit C
MLSVCSLTSVLAMNAAICASVVLASRLDTDIAVLALILFAVESFILYPILKSRVQVSSNCLPLEQEEDVLTTCRGGKHLSRPVWILMTMFLSFFALHSLAQLSRAVMAICSAVLTFITFIAPMLLVWAQKYKK